MKTDSQFPFLPTHGSLSAQEEALHGSLSCPSPGSLTGTVYNTLGGGQQNRPGCAASVGQAAEVVAFPLSRRQNKLADVARKLAKTTSARHEAYYRSQVSYALDRAMARQGIPPDSRTRELSTFWRAVGVAVAQLRHPTKSA